MRLLLCAAAALFVAAPAAAQPVTADQLRAHVERLADDAFQGRGPATPGEPPTIAYIAAELARRGIEPGAPGGGWFQQVALVERRPAAHRTRWTAGGRRLRFDDRAITLVGAPGVQRIADAPVLFAGHGLGDQIAGADLAGAIALVLVESPDVPDFPSFARRAAAVEAAGAAAVIGIVGDDLPWWAMVEMARIGETSLDRGAAGAVRGTIAASSVAELLAAAGGDFEAMLNAQAGPAFRAVPLPLRASFDVTSTGRRYRSNNVIGRIGGTGGGAESLLLLAHWDHFGLCRGESEADRICNGAVDNASGIASLIEIAGRLARGPRPERDIFLLATTAEEVGLRGAEHFAAHPPAPIESFVAALNIDSVAVHPAGSPVAIVGAPDPLLHAAVAETAAALGRRMDSDEEAAAFNRRQDGWALHEAGVPAALVSGAFSDMALLRRYIDGPYHGPDDEYRPDLPLAGAAEDADLLVALARRLADPARYRPRRRAFTG